MGLPRPCKAPYCPETVTDGPRCTKHRKQREARRRERRGRRPYDAPEWRNEVRPAQLSREPFCRHCGAPATEVDHIDGDATNHNPSNLRSLCKSCHSRRTASEQV